MAEYTVHWYGTYESDDPAGAAVEAWKAMQRRGSIANVFDVSDQMGMTVRVDLDDSTAGPPKWVPERHQVAELAEWMDKEQWDITDIVDMIRKPHKYADEYSQMIVERAFDEVAKEPEVDDTDED
jgi:hypothetical protein